MALHCAAYLWGNETLFGPRIIDKQRLYFTQVAMSKTFTFLEDPNLTTIPSLTTRVSENILIYNQIVCFIVSKGTQTLTTEQKIE